MKKFVGKWFGINRYCGPSPLWGIVPLMIWKETWIAMKDRMNDRRHLHEMVSISQRVYALQHIETGEYICLRQGGREYLACYTDGDSAMQFRQELGLLEHVDVTQMSLCDAPFRYFWLDGETISRSVLVGATPSRP